MDARDLRLLYDNQIRAVVDLAVNEVPAQLAREMIYCRFPIVDGDGNPDTTIEMAIRTVSMLAQNKIRAMIACSAGMSRSPSIAAAALAMITDQTPDECLQSIVAIGPHDVSPILWNRVKSVYTKIVRT